MGLRLTWTDCEEAGDYVVPNVLCPRDLVCRPDNIDETVLHQETLSIFISMNFCYSQGVNGWYHIKIILNIPKGELW